MKSLAAAEREARNLVNAWSVVAVGVGWVPGSMIALATADVALVKDVASAFGVRSYILEEVTGAMTASIYGKAMAGEVLSLFPGLGWVAKSGVAGAITKTMGETLIAYMKNRSPYK